MRHPRHVTQWLAVLSAALTGACAASLDPAAQHGAAPPTAAQHCAAAIDTQQLELDYDAFDAAGWRELLARGCTDQAVAQLEAYRTENSARLRPDQILEMHFHAGQALAMSGHDQAGIPHFEEARGGEAEWSASVDATLAFLRRDAAALAAARARYAQAPGASSMRLAFIDGFIACPDQPYVRAVHCAMAH